MATDKATDNILRTGDIVRLNDRTFGRVRLASPNGRSVVVDLEEPLMIDGGMMLNYALLDIDYEQETVRELITGEEVIVEVQAGEQAK